MYRLFQDRSSSSPCHSVTVSWETLLCSPGTGTFPPMPTGMLPIPQECLWLKVGQEWGESGYTWGTKTSSSKQNQHMQERPSPGSLQRTPLRGSSTWQPVTLTCVTCGNWPPPQSFHFPPYLGKTRTVPSIWKDRSSCAPSPIPRFQPGARQLNDTASRGECLGATVQLASGD